MRLALHYPLLLRFIAALVIMSLVFAMSPLNTVSAAELIDCESAEDLDQKMIDLDAGYYGPCDTLDSANSSQCSVSIVGSTSQNKDYAGREILTKTQLQEIAKNQPIYEKAAQKVDIPWQIIAVIHIRETGLGRDNPSNGQGIYQFYDKRGGPYPTGPVSDKEFERQTVFVAEFIKGKAGANYEGNKTLTASSAPNVIKDTLFSYNGRAGVYERQAQSLGYKANEGYEGSPYVMNKADAKRDPGKNPDGWGQIKTDGGGIVYPANEGYGGFVQYAALTGADLGGACNGIGGPVRQKVVALARQELELWKNGTLKPGSDFHKYSYGANVNWCAYFVSWIYNEAGYPLKEGKNGAVPSVDETRSIGEKEDKFTFTKAGEYTPQPGDIVVQKNTDPSDYISHVMLVVAVDGNKMTVIGGNQGGSPFTSSKVTEYTITGFAVDNIVGYVSPKGGQ